MSIHMQPIQMMHVLCSLVMALHNVHKSPSDEKFICRRTFLTFAFCESSLNSSYADDTSCWNELSIGTKRENPVGRLRTARANKAFAFLS